MIPEIEAQISRLKQAFSSLKSKLDHEIQVSNGLRTKIDQLNIDNKTLETQNQQLEQLQASLKAQWEQNIIMQGKETSLVNSNVGRSDEEIDALVKDIEHCIAQLKQNT